MTNPDPTPAGDNAAVHNDAPPQVAAAAHRGGRPSKLTAGLVADTLDALRARDGHDPSVRELQRLLGGARTTITTLRDEVRGARLVAAAVPMAGPLDKTLSEVVANVFKALGIEAARAADAAVGAARTEADGRVEAAECVRDRARRAEADTALERERALGRVGSLEETLTEVRTGHDATARLLAEAREELLALRGTVAERDRKIERLTGATVIAEAAVVSVHEAMVERDAAATAAAHAAKSATAAELASAVAEAAATAERLRAEHAAEHTIWADERGVLRAEHAREAATLADVAARLDAALARADELGDRVRRLESERDEARTRAERLDAVLQTTRHTAHRARNDHEVTRRTALELHTHLGRLEARLLAAGVPAAEITPVPTLSLAEDWGGLDVHEVAEEIKPDNANPSAPGTVRRER